MPNPIYHHAESNQNYIHYLPFMMNKGFHALCVMEIGTKFYVLESNKEGMEFYLDPVNPRILSEAEFDSFQKEQEKKGYNLVFDYEKNIFKAYKSYWAGSCSFTAEEMKNDAVLLPCKWGMCEGHGRSDRTISFYLKSLKEVNKKSFNEENAETQRKSIVAFMEMDHSIKIPFFTDKSWETAQVLVDLKKIAEMDGVLEVPQEKIILNAGIGSYGLDIRNALWYCLKHGDNQMFSFIVDRYDILSNLPMSHVDMVLDVVRGSEEFVQTFVNKINLDKLKAEDRSLGTVILSMAKKWEEVEAQASDKNKKYLYERFLKMYKDKVY